MRRYSKLDVVDFKKMQLMAGDQKTKDAKAMERKAKTETPRGKRADLHKNHNQTEEQFVIVAASCCLQPTHFVGSVGKTQCVVF